MIAPTASPWRRPSDQPPTDARGRAVPANARPAGQSRFLSGLEAAANVLLGMGLSLILQGLLFPLIGVEASLGQHLSLLAVFTVMSFLRAYILRRIFERRRRSAR